MVFIPKWMLATGCKIKAPGNDFFYFERKCAKIGTPMARGRNPENLPFSHWAPCLPWSASRLPWSATVGGPWKPKAIKMEPDGAKMDPKMMSGDPRLRVFRSKTATQICATIGTAFTLSAYFLLAVCLLPSCFLACFLLPCCLLPCCLLPCLLAACLLPIARWRGWRQPLDICIYI